MNYSVYNVCPKCGAYWQCDCPERPQAPDSHKLTPVEMAMDKGNLVSLGDTDWQGRPLFPPQEDAE